MDNRPLDALREGDEASEMVKKTGGVLKDYSSNAVVKIGWDMNEEAKKHQIFVLSINGEEAYLDKQEFMRYLRFV